MEHREHRSEQRADPAQETAIRKGAGPCAVIAGPGSGKTFVLVERVRYLIEARGADPSSILVLTFSRTAAAHMRRRFLHSCAHPETVFGTFHSVFFRILQESSAQKPRLIDPGEKKSYLRHLCDLRPPFLPEKTAAEELQLLISRYKNDLPCRQDWIPELVKAYDGYLEGRGLLDFDDMILRCRKLLQENPDTLALWRERFRWILVDEFQDVSPVQYETLLLLAAPADNLFIVGDDDQSIYGFRGADPLMMQRFLSDFMPDTEDRASRVVLLTTNYRCVSAVLKPASALIRCNKNRIDKAFRAGSAQRGSFSCLPFSGRELQYSFIARELKSMTPRERGQTAVIFRTHRAAGQFLCVLQEQEIAFLAAGTGQKQTVPTDRTKILQDLAAYYKAAEGLGEETFVPESLFSPGKGISRGDLLRIMNRPQRFLSGSFIASDRMDRGQLLRHAGYEREAVAELIRDLESLNVLSPVYSMRYLLNSVGYRGYARSVYQKGEEILERLEEDAREYASSRQWLLRLETLWKASGRQDASEDTSESSAAGMTAGEEAVSAAAGKEAGKKTGKEAVPEVRILTMHACKGLEFDRVFIPDVNEGSIPSRRAWTSDQVEEERRLLYVAMTRARLSLTLTYREGTPDRPAAPSRFLQPFVRTGS